jgi:hypothetical protein
MQVESLRYEQGEVMSNVLTDKCWIVENLMWQDGRYSGWRVHDTAEYTGLEVLALIAYRDSEQRFNIRPMPGNKWRVKELLDAGLNMLAKAEQRIHYVE